MRAKYQGFKLVEVLFMMGVIAVIATIGLLATSQAGRVRWENDDKRHNDISQILNTVSQYAADNGGQYPVGITESPKVICTAVTWNGCVDLSVLTRGELYLPSLPVDPTCGSESGTGYAISMSSDPGIRITVSAPCAETERTIEVSR